MGKVRFYFILTLLLFTSLGCKEIGVGGSGSQSEIIPKKCEYELDSEGKCIAPDINHDPSLDNGMITIRTPYEGEPSIHYTAYVGCPLLSIKAEPGIAWVEFIVDGVLIDRGSIAIVKLGVSGNLLPPNKDEKHVQYSDFSFQSAKHLVDSNYSHLFSIWLYAGDFYNYYDFFMTPGMHNFEVRGYDMSDNLITTATREFLVMEDSDPINWQNPPVTTEGNDLNLDNEEQKFLELINNYRATNGLSPLVSDQVFVKAAQEFSDSMAKNNYFPEDHKDLLGRSPLDRLHDAGYSGYSYSENIFSGFCDAESAFNAWMLSPPHNANMLLENMSKIGIARSYDPNYSYWYRCYWVTDFGN